jgi:hypothetical protein
MREYHALFPTTIFRDEGNNRRLRQDEDPIETMN